MLSAGSSIFFAEKFIRNFLEKILSKFFTDEFFFQCIVSVCMAQLVSPFEAFHTVASAFVIE